MEAAPALPGGLRPTCRFFLVLTAEQRELCYPGPGVSVRGLSVRMLSLGAGARDEVHVLEAEGAKVNGQTVSHSSAKLSLQPCLPILGLSLALTPPVTFRLKAGPGPLFISGLVAEEAAGDPAAMVTEKEEEAEPPGASQAHAAARGDSSSVDLQIAKSLTEWKRLHEMHGMYTTPAPRPAVGEGLSAASPDGSLGNSDHICKAKGLSQGTNVCPSPPVSPLTIPGTPGGKGTGATDLACSGEPTLGLLPSSKKKKKANRPLMRVKQMKAPATPDEMKEKVLQSLKKGTKIPIQIFRFKEYLQQRFKYEDEDYSHLVELWRWRISFFKTYG